MTPSLLLGSQSPRRQEILSFFQLPFTVCSSGFDEMTIPFQGCAKTFVLSQAKEKALALVKHHSNSIIITADTTVAFKGKIFQKPADEQEAFLFLQELAGNTHEVFTGVCVAYQQNLFLEAALTKVTFHPLSPTQIRQYLSKVNPLDKAGAYAIQGVGSLIVAKIEGCYYNVMGLPVSVLSCLLQKMGVNLWE